MKKTLIFGVLLFLSLIVPVLYYYYEGEHKILNESTYLSRNNNNNETQRVEKFNQYRIIYHAYKNIKLGRYDSFSTIDDNNVINSFPLYKYYSPALFYLLGLLMFVFKDVVITYTFGLWVFSLIYVGGIYLLAKKITQDTYTAVVTTLVAVTTPYIGTNALSRYGYSEQVAGFMVPMLLYLLIEMVEKGAVFSLKGDSRFTSSTSVRILLDYLLISSLFTALGTLFILTHNITTLYSPFVFGIPLVVYIWREVKPSLKSLLLACIPFILIALSSLYYILPSVQTQTRLLISDTFNGLLFPYIKLNTLQSLFSITPTMSPISTTPALWLQIGVPTVLLALLFFRLRNIHVYVLFGLLVFMIISPVIWHHMPQPFLAIQFPYRLLAYIPLLFVFASRKLSRIPLILVTIITLVFAVIFFQRPSTPGSFYGYDFDMFPSENAWNYYYRGDNQNVVINGISAPEETVLNSNPDPKNKLAYTIPLDNDKNKLQAVSYQFSIENVDDKKLPYAVETATTFNNGKITNRLLRYGVINNTSIFVSYCLRNVKKQITTLGVPPEFKGPLTISRFNDSRQMYLPSGDQFFTVTCNYEEKENGRIFVFHPEKLTEEKTILLPIFFSDLHQVLGHDGNPLSTQSFLDAEMRSLTAVKNPKDNDEIRIKLFGNDHWTEISYPVIFLIVLVTILLVIAKIGTIINPQKSHAKTHL